MGTDKYKASVYLSNDELDLLEQVSKDYRLSKSQLLILAIKTIATISPESNPITNGSKVNKKIDDTLTKSNTAELLNNSTEELEVEMEGIKENLEKINKWSVDIDNQLRTIFQNIEFLKFECGLPSDYQEDEENKPEPPPPPGAIKPIDPEDLISPYEEIYYRSIAVVAAEYGLNRPTLSKWVNGKQAPQSQKFRAIFEEIQNKYLFVPGKGFKER